MNHSNLKSKGPLADWEIRDLCLDIVTGIEEPMITPFVNGQVRKVKQANSDESKRIISYGLSSMGYDVRLDTKFKLFTNVNAGIIDPLSEDDSEHFIEKEGDFIIIPPNSYVLGVTVERFVIPRDVIVICLGKSTYARKGILINVTPIENGFEGNVVIEISNSTPLPCKVYAKMGIAQFLFFRGNECETSYGDRGGKYQGQTGVQTGLL